jgi:hypothetical protein
VGFAKQQGTDLGNMSGVEEWDVMPCSPADIRQRFGGIYCLRLQGRTGSQARNRQEASRNISYMSCIILMGSNSAVSEDAVRHVL